MILTILISFDQRYALAQPVRAALFDTRARRLRMHRGPISTIREEPEAG
jgi:hypothetical protein